MKVTHLTEEMIQQYVLEKASCNQEDIEHIEHCAHCQAQASLYSSMFTAISDEPKASFDFNIEELVMAQMPQDAPVLSHEKKFMFILVAAVVAAFGIAGYWLRHDLALLFNNASAMLTVILVTAIIVIAVFHGIDLYRRYQHKMHALDLY